MQDHYESCRISTIALSALVSESALLVSLKDQIVISVEVFMKLSGLMVPAKRKGVLLS